MSTTGTPRAGPDAFARCREAVSAQAAAERYGVEVRRGWARCPLHGEKTPSLRFYPDGHFYCFGCHRGGSAIDFTAALLGLQPLDALGRLDGDFGLGLMDTPPPDAEQLRLRQRRKAAAQNFDDWRWELIRALGAAQREAHWGLQAADSAGTLDAVSPEQALALRYREALDAWQDTLVSGTMEEQMEIFRNRKEIVKVCEAILKNTSRKLRWA